MDTHSLKWPSRLVVIRHGRSELNEAKDLLDKGIEDKLRALSEKRDVDMELVAEGIYQAQETGKYLATTEPFDICFSSPYKRTLDTAKNIIEQLPYALPIFKVNRLREKEFGSLHGLSSQDIKEQFPHEYKARQRDGKYYYRLPGGENYLDVEDRVHRFLDKLIREYAGKHVVIVTHHVPCVMFRAIFEHLGEKEVLDLGDVHNCGMAEYRPDTSKKPEGKMRTLSWNQIAYSKMP